MAAKEVDMIYHLSRVQHHRYSGQHGAAPLSRSSVFSLASPGSQPSQGWIERLYQHVSALTQQRQKSLQTGSCDNIIAAATHSQKEMRRFIRGSCTCTLHFFNPGAAAGQIRQSLLAEWWQTTPSCGSSNFCWGSCTSWISHFLSSPLQDCTRS